MAIHIITLSDRASHGEYEDKGGPLIREIFENWLACSSIQARFVPKLLPDAPERLQPALEEAVCSGADIIVTTGGTGVGPRDFTPDVVLEFADKTIPGIMEHIRLKYGQKKPLALLSRGVAATKRTTLIYTLPGSPKAVEEYMNEILVTLPHLLCVVHGLGIH